MIDEAEWMRHRQDGATAEDRCDWPAAIVAYEAALSSLPPDASSAVLEADLLTALGACYWNTSEARTAWRTLRRAMSLYREHADAAGFARATVQVLRIWGSWDRQLAMADEALEMLGDREPYLRARLLLATSWRGKDARWDEAIALAETHRFEDILASKTHLRARDVYREAGDIEGSITLALEAHETYARLKAYDPACDALRGVGFGTFEHGLLDRGAELARRCVDYARSVGLRFHEQLALMDLAGEAFARCDFERCLAVCDEMETNTDFRADLYRMWIVEVSGDVRGAVQMMVDPERAGRAATGLSQTHGAAAGILYRAGLQEPARDELRQWAEIARPNGALAVEVPALFECVAALGDDELVKDICDACETRGPETWPPPVYATLQGRALAPAHGAMLMRLGRVDDAERAYRDGLAWCERERVPLDAARCHDGLARIASDRGDAARARVHAETAERLRAASLPPAAP